MSLNLGVEGQSNPLSQMTGQAPLTCLRKPWAPAHTHRKTSQTHRSQKLDRHNRILKTDTPHKEETLLKLTTDTKKDTAYNLNRQREKAWQIISKLDCKTKYIMRRSRIEMTQLAVKPRRPPRSPKSAWTPNPNGELQTLIEGRITPVAECRADCGGMGFWASWNLHRLFMDYGI